MAEEAIVFARVDAAVHKVAVAYCEQRQIPMRLFVQELLRWAVSQDASSLVRTGVRLPLWPEDFEKSAQPD